MQGRTPIVFFAEKANALWPTIIEYRGYLLAVSFSSLSLSLPPLILMCTSPFYLVGTLITHSTLKYK